MAIIPPVLKRKLLLEIVSIVADKGKRYARIFTHSIDFMHKSQKNILYDFHALMEFEIFVVLWPRKKYMSLKRA